MCAIIYATLHVSSAMDMRLSCNSSEDEGILRDSPMSKSEVVSCLLCRHEVPVLSCKMVCPFLNCLITGPS